MKEKALQIIAFCSIFTHYAAELLKKDVKWFRHKNKQLLLQLIDENVKTIKEYENCKALLFQDKDVKLNLELHHKAITGKDVDYDKEAIEEDLNIIQELFGIFLEIYLKTAPFEMINLSIILRNFRDGKRLYTEDEVNKLLKDKNDK
jgi:hypothetical protein